MSENEGNVPQSESTPSNVKGFDAAPQMCFCNHRWHRGACGKPVLDQHGAATDEKCDCTVGIRTDVATARVLMFGIAPALQQTAPAVQQIAQNQIAAYNGIMEGLQVLAGTIVELGKCLSPEFAAKIAEREAAMAKEQAEAEERAKAAHDQQQAQAVADQVAHEAIHGVPAGAPAGVPAGAPAGPRGVPSPEEIEQAYEAARPSPIITPPTSILRPPPPPWAEGGLPSIRDKKKED